MKILLKVSFSLYLFITVLSSVSWAASDYRDISPQQVREMLGSQKEGLLLLDVRTEEEYEEGHLKNATLIPVQVLGKRLDEIAGYRDKVVIVYCAIGGRSSNASAYLTRNNFKNVYNMSGGFKSWSRSGYEIER